MSTISVGKYEVSVPTVKSLFIEMYFQDLRLASGTGTLVAFDRESHCALVTNRHNVTGRDQVTGKCLSKNAAIPDSVVIHFHGSGERSGEWLPIRLPLYRQDGTPYWIEHPRLGAVADIVALNLSWGGDVLKYPYYLNTALDRKSIQVGPAEAVSVIGFPFGLSSIQRFPIWATGFLAQELELISPDDPTFLIDCRTRQGQSGSAVIAYRVGNHRILGADGRIASVLSPHPVWEFLGIYSGRLNPESDLGKVWHVSAVEELVIAAAEDDERRRARAAQNGADQV
ncbi:hypothetical protein ACU5AY_05075 [Rhizobium sp. PAMB 3174]